MINIVCVLRKGGKVNYTNEWVDKLQNSISRNVTIPYNFFCLSDCDVNCHRIPLITTFPKFWAKMELFRPNIFNGPVLYLDLDIVICENLDEILLNIQKFKFLMVREPSGIHNSSILWINDDYSFLWNLFNSKPLEYWQEIYIKPPLYGDQAFISEHTEHDIINDYFPVEWITFASKKQIEPEDTKLLIFIKPSQKPSTMPGHKLVNKHWN